MKFDFKKIGKILGAGVAATIVMKVIYDLAIGFLLDEKIKKIVDVAKKQAEAAKITFDPAKYLATADLAKFVAASNQALMLAAGVVVIASSKFLKNTELKLAAWAAAGLPIAVGASSYLDKTGKIAAMLDFPAFSLEDKKPTSTGTVAGDDDGITIPASQIIDFMAARRGAQEVNGAVADIVHDLDGDVSDTISEFMAGDDDDDEDDFLNAA